MPSSIEVGLSRPWHRLRLPQHLEAQYHAEDVPPRGLYMQSWLLIFVLFNIISLKIDFDLFGRDAIAVPAGLTVGVFIPLALGWIVALRGRPSLRRQGAAATITSLADMAIVLNSARIVPQEHADTYLILAAIVPLVVGMISPLSFRYSLWFCGLAFLLYVGFVFMSGFGPEGHTGVPLLVAALILVPIKLAYSREWDRKKSFLLGLREREQADELARACAHLTILSETDPLTGVANRRLFTEQLEDHWELAATGHEWFGVILVDIDHFKRLNDTAGHAEGDGCLVSVADTLTRDLARWGGLVCRYGGEEFAAFVPRATAETIQDVGESLRLAVMDLAIPHPGLQDGGVVTVSIGVTAAHGATRHVGLSASQLLRAADAALYAAKKVGRNRVESQSVISPANSSQITEHAA
ncbi:GGDEF domain-containing protein [Methylobacterium sp. W2]|uniref:GGDEF domain-containing protein n=1 Tax=Methylobacterium sp. W2 TaxID=2598107 RepID=UPI001D0C7CC2|nr:diguanylate cyclase [Methylobacterium sp. W2]MCC0809315.1 GGDEF domain-containing protein [Methylobacterium sp. W2]